jgi:hypothetical protein
LQTPFRNYRLYKKSPQEEPDVLLKDKNSFFESGSSKNPRLIGLCDAWGWVTTYCAAADGALSPIRLHPIKSHIQNEDCNVNPAIVDPGYKKPANGVKP